MDLSRAMIPAVNAAMSSVKVAIAFPSQQLIFPKLSFCRLPNQVPPCITPICDHRLAALVSVLQPFYLSSLSLCQSFFGSLPACPIMPRPKTEGVDGCYFQLPTPDALRNSDMEPLFTMPSSTKRVRFQGCKKLP